MVETRSAASRGRAQTGRSRRPCRRTGCAARAALSGGPASGGQPQADRVWDRGAHSRIDRRLDSSRSAQNAGPARDRCSSSRRRTGRCAARRGNRRGAAAQRSIAELARDRRRRGSATPRPARTIAWLQRCGPARGRRAAVACGRKSAFGGRSSSGGEPDHGSGSRSRVTRRWSRWAGEVRPRTSSSRTGSRLEPVVQSRQARSRYRRARQFEDLLGVAGRYAEPHGWVGCLEPTQEIREDIRVIAGARKAHSRKEGARSRFFRTVRRARNAAPRTAGIRVPRSVNAIPRRPRRKSGCRPQHRRPEPRTQRGGDEQGSAGDSGSSPRDLEKPSTCCQRIRPLQLKMHRPVRHPVPFIIPALMAAIRCSIDLSHGVPPWVSGVPRRGPALQGGDMAMQHHPNHDRSPPATARRVGTTGRPVVTRRPSPASPSCRRHGETCRRSPPTARPCSVSIRGCGATREH